MANALEELIENPIEDGENPIDEVDKELELQGTGGNSEMANALEKHFENPIEDGENPIDVVDKELELQGTGGNSEMANALEQHFENSIEDGEKPKDEMDKALELQGIGGNIDSDSDSDSDGLVDETPSRRANIHTQNFQKLLKAPMEQFDINKMDTIPPDMIDEVLHCTFRHLKLKLKIDRVLLRTLHRKQWVVSQLKDTFLVRMDNEKQTALVQPRSLCHMAKDKIMELFMRATLFQLQEQLGRFEKRVAELKDLQKNQILWKIRSQKVKATGSGGTAKSNEGAGPAGVYKAPTDDTGYIACELRRDIAYLEKSIIASQHYKDHQAEFIKKMREHNQLLRQPLSGVPLLAPNAPQAADPSTSQLVEIMDPECAPKAPILLEERDSKLERLIDLKKKLQLVVPGGGQ